MFEKYKDEITIFGCIYMYFFKQNLTFSSVMIIVLIMIVTIKKINNASTNNKDFDLYD